MLERAMPRDSALVEVLDTLRHDLAKYLSLPLRMLPGDADAAAVRGGLQQALEQTLSSASGPRSAEAIYAELRPQLVAAGAAPTRLQALDVAVVSALGWRAALCSHERLERSAIERDFAAVAGILDDWLDEVTDG
jgi:hypothetical protein